MFETENPSSVEREMSLNLVFECKAGVIMEIDKEALTFKLYKIRRYMSKICWNAFLGCFHILNFFENLKNFDKALPLSNDVQTETRNRPINLDAMQKRF